MDIGGFLSWTVMLLLQVLPLLKAFFVLCEARTAHLPAPAGSGGARRAASLDISRGASMDMPELATQPSTALSIASEKAAAEAHLPFLRCASIAGDTPAAYPVTTAALPCLRRTAKTNCPQCDEVPHQQQQFEAGHLHQGSSWVRVGRMRVRVCTVCHPASCQPCARWELWMV